jgi:hypothetical protein
MKMLRKPGPIAFLLLCLFAGCDPFSTKPISSKPSEVSSLQDAAKVGDSVVFRVTESLNNAASGALLQTLASKRVVFTRAKDTTVGGVTYRAYSMGVTDDVSKALLEKSIRLLRREDGVELRLPGGGGGARFFPLKIAASDTAAFRALPPLFASGTEWDATLGTLQVTRAVDGEDTLNAGAGLEESWRVAETVSDGGRAVAHGHYWYGSSGLLKAEQTWDEFDRRDESGAAAGPKPVLRRALERL